jgi:hypothetical protein
VGGGAAVTSFICLFICNSAFSTDDVVCDLSR